MADRVTAQSLVIGLTGGPGVGKSEVARILSRRGLPVISADAIGHEILRSDKVVRRRLFTMFGQEIMSADGELNRRRLGRIVFGDYSRLALFNKIVHPVLLCRLRQELRQKEKMAPVVVVDAALIFEWGIADWFDMILVVDAKRALRISRLAREGLTRSEIARRIGCQMRQSDKKRLADFVIINNGSLSELRRQVNRLLETILPASFGDCQGAIRHRRQFGDRSSCRSESKKRIKVAVKR